MDKIELYHAGTERIERPDCTLGRKNLDFGRGFYLTDMYDQAVIWAGKKSRERQLPALINVYVFDKASCLSEARAKIFDRYNEEWLEFVVACRTKKEVWKDFDYN